MGENKISLSTFFDKIDILLSSIPILFSTVVPQAFSKYAKSF